MDKAEWLWFHHEQVAAIEFDPRYELGPYVYVETYDTHQQAVNIATLFETAGYVADIRKVSQKYFAASAGGTPMLKTVTSRSLLK